MDSLYWGNSIYLRVSIANLHFSTVQPIEVLRVKEVARQLLLCQSFLTMNVIQFDLTSGSKSKDLKNKGKNYVIKTITVYIKI